MTPRHYCLPFNSCAYLSSHFLLDEKVNELGPPPDGLPSIYLPLFLLLAWLKSHKPMMLVPLVCAKAKDHAL